ncbi:MAG: comB [Anaerosporomusa subterranea]|jgi:2-phosphosulfolactate phosphatase|nr:comB [Anaerosporomusa subterranea]
MQINVCLTPSEYVIEQYRDWNAVVIDVFRATSSMAAAFANKCATVIPVETVEEALQKKQTQPDVLLAGERNALKVNGFDLGNSPLEFTADAVRDKTIIMSTTNGTVALVKAAESAAVYTAAFVNAAAVCRTLREHSRDTVLICAGRKGEFALEDALCAGLLADRLADLAVLSDSAQFTRSAYREVSPKLLQRVSESRHARYLSEIGLGEDVAWCLQYDIFDVVPCFSKGKVRVVPG